MGEIQGLSVRSSVETKVEVSPTSLKFCKRDSREHII